MFTQPSFLDHQGLPATLLPRGGFPQQNCSFEKLRKSTYPTQETGSLGTYLVGSGKALTIINKVCFEFVLQVPADCVMLVEEETKAQLTR